MLGSKRGKLSTQEEGAFHELISDTGEINALLSQCKEEREKLNAVLKESSTIDKISEKLFQMEGLAGKLDKRIIHVTESNLIFESLEDKLIKLKDMVTSVEHKAEGLVEREASLESSHQECERVNSSVAALKTELEKLREISKDALGKVHEVSGKKVEFAELSEKLGKSSETLRHFSEQIANFRGNISSLEGQLSEFSSKIAAGKASVQTIEDRTKELIEEKELYLQARQRIVSLNSLIELVNTKIENVSQQKILVDKANEEAGRLNVLIWDMDAKIARLTKEAKLIKKSDKMPLCYTKTQ